MRRWERASLGDDLVRAATRKSAFTHRAKRSVYITRVIPDTFPITYYYSASVQGDAACRKSR
jgi:hypothetical protein